jgi:hypothetical protein
MSRGNPRSRAGTAALCLALAAAGAARADEAPGRFHSPRFEDDFSYLARPDAPRDFWDPIKYVPLSHEPHVYLSFGGELRERFEYYADPDFGVNGGGDDGYLLHRMLVHADLHAGEHLRAFVQLGSELELGKSDPLAPIDVDHLDLQQGFAEAKLPGSPLGDLMLRVGRQEMAYGSSRLVSVRESPNVRRSFDAVRFGASSGRARIDAFVSHPVKTENGVFDDSWNQQQAFWGAYGVLREIAEQPGLNLDLYYLGLRREDAPLAAFVDTEHRHTIGARFWGEARSFDYNVEAIGQLGTYGPQDILAWSVASDLGYTLAAAPFSPRLGVKANISSGDRDPDDDDINTFNPLFPKLNYFSEAALQAPINLIDVAPSLTFALCENLSATIGYDAFWRTSKDDAVYDSSLSPLIPAAASSNRYIGTQVNLELELALGRHVAMLAAYAHFFAGAVVDDGGGGDVDFAMMSVSYKF